MGHVLGLDVGERDSRLERVPPSADSSAGRRPASRAAAPRWSGGPAAGSRNRPAGGSCWSDRPGTGPVPHGPVIRPRPGARWVAQHGRRKPRRVDVRRRRAPRSGRVLVRPHHRGIDRHRPGRACCLVAPRPQPVQDHLPGPVAGPAAMPVIDSLPIEPLRQVPPREPGPGPEEDPVDHQPVVIPPVPLPRMPRLQPRPLLIAEVMTP